MWLFNPYQGFKFIFVRKRNGLDQGKPEQDRMDRAVFRGRVRSLGFTNSQKLEKKLLFGPKSSG